MRVLIVEDYAPVRASVARALRREGYAVDEARDGDDGLRLALDRDYDVVLLDLMLPGIDGLEVLRRLRDAERPSQVLVLSARDTIADRVKGLDLGADDYLVKPFAIDELLARVRALVRRAYGRRRPIVRVGHIEVDTARRAVLVEGERVELTAKEYAVLEYLASRVDEVVTRAEILEHISDRRASASGNVIDVYVTHLRQKIERPGRGKLLHTRRGAGYLFGEDRGSGTSRLR